MAQQDTDQQHAGVLPVDDEGYVVDTEDCEAREAAWRERGTSRPITVVGNPVLHRECADVTDFGDELRQLVADMFASQRTASGVGLAANQIGVGLKVFVYDCPEVKGGPRHVGVVCNPRLVERPAAERRLAEGKEGCLSVPTAFAELARPDYAEVTGQDVRGNPVRVRGRDFFARCLQHETDHLYGRLYIDRLSARDRKDALRQMAEGEPRYPVADHG
ncbi:MULTISPECIES: peptide deformylase [unclassified Streptomyces]|uniref:peptide deformylase n=1 Tax=unclassified Streptomyces TaxID=2593676 RepID=UPI0007F9BFE0|nr:peptide deformylase [Streptomyces sp. SAT1]ANO42238.1 peptide deformylase [Streptomyces sp. SAT1]